MRTDPIAPDLTQLKALTHPLRLRLLGQLRLHGPATATGLAGRVGESSGSTSYHLRQLERHGFVEEASELGNRRERWWRATAYLTTTSGESADAAEAEVKTALRQVVVSTLAGRMQASAAEHDLLPEEWRRVVESSDATVHATPEQAAEISRRLNAIIWEVIDEYPTPPGPAPEGTRLFEIQVHAFPTPGQQP